MPGYFQAQPDFPRELRLVQAHYTCRGGRASSLRSWLDVDRSWPDPGSMLTDLGSILVQSWPDVDRCHANAALNYRTVWGHKSSDPLRPSRVLIKRFVCRCGLIVCRVSADHHPMACIRLGQMWAALAAIVLDRSPLQNCGGGEPWLGRCVLQRRSDSKSLRLPTSSAPQTTQSLASLRSDGAVGAQLGIHNWTSDANEYELPA